MRICYFGSYDPEYVRNSTLREGLRRGGATVHTCQYPLWRNSQDRVSSAARPGVGTAWRVARAQAGLVRRYASVPPHDVVLVGYPGHTDMLTARLCARSRRHRVAFDAFLSLYETAVEDRALVRGALARALHFADAASVGLADLTLMDTEEHAEHFRRSVAAGARYAVVPVSAEDAYLDVPAKHRLASEPLRVLYFGAYIPLHGMDVIVEAARLLAGDRVHFELIGDGQLLAKTRDLASRLRLTNVSFDATWHSLPDLIEHIAAADVCLGIFAPSAKAARVLPNKVVAGLASGRPVVTAATPAAEHALTHDDTALLCAAGDARSLAVQLARLRDDPDLAIHVSGRARQLFRERYSVDAVGRRLIEVLRPLAAA